MEISIESPVASIRIGNHPPGVKNPVWAWYQWQGKRKKPDMRSRHGEPGRRIVRLTLEVDEKDMLLSDFDEWRIPLNHDYLSLTEQEDEEIEDEYKKYGYSYHDLQDQSIRDRCRENQGSLRPFNSTKN